MVGAETRLRSAIDGDVLFDTFSRGRYATDASVYQITPTGVVIPKTTEDVLRAMEIAADAGLTVLPRGAGTSQCGQTVAESLVIDCSRHLNQVVEFDAEQRRITVQPGMVLDQLNAFLKPHGLWFPVDVSTSSRATIGGMAGNNSCGARSIVYGTMRDNVHAIDALLPGGAEYRFGEIAPHADRTNAPHAHTEMVNALLQLGEREADEIDRRFPKLMRRVGGYNIDALVPGTGPDQPRNLAHLLVGSEGTLAFTRQIELALSPLPGRRVLGVCHFQSFYAAMDATQHLVGLGPSAVELVDRNMIELARDVPMFRATTSRFVKGEPAALLLVEFAGEEEAPLLRKLDLLEQRMSELGFPDAVVKATEPAFQGAIWELRKSGLNIMMSMRSEGKPVSFVEDCAVELPDLAEYTDRLENVFRKHGSSGTWYAHASVGCLHVRPVLNLKLDEDVRKMRAIAEEAFEMVREYKGSHSGEHGDGLVRSEFHEAMFGERMVRNFEEVKDCLDPQGLLNPGKIVRPPKMDDRTLFRFKPGYRVIPIQTGLDWSHWNGFGGAVEMCNNNGACRKFDAGVMCPSFRVTRDEQHLTRGRANTLRLAISGQLGADALTSDAMRETMKLCVGCKGCKRECPTGVDMARMKIEVQHQHVKRHGLTLHDRLIAHLPRYAPLASRFAPLMNLPARLPPLAKLLERVTGFSADRPLPLWSRKPFQPAESAFGPEGASEVVLLADTFNSWFEPENLEAALHVLTHAGYRVHVAGLGGSSTERLCCGRTYLSTGLIDEARATLQRLVDTLHPFVERGVPIVGLEPSCLLTLRDEALVVLPGDRTRALAEQALLFEEFLARESAAGRLELKLQPMPNTSALLHGHCHQKAFAAMGDVERVLGLIPELQVKNIESSCCGMAGAFGYSKDTAAVSREMGELSLLPAVRAASMETLIIADGTSCRHQIADGAGREALHVARVLAQATARAQ